MAKAIPCATWEEVLAADAADVLYVNNMVGGYRKRAKYPHTHPPSRVFFDAFENMYFIMVEDEE